MGSALLLFVILLQAGGVIRGQILIPSTRASERIQVVLQRADGPIIGRNYSDTLGNFEFRGLPAGAYDVLVSVEGYEDVRQSVAVGGGGPFGTVTVNIPLVEKTSSIERPALSPGEDANTVDIVELSRRHPKRAIQDYQRAVEENRKGNAAKAVELLTGVVKLAPEFYAAHNTLGTIYQRMNRYAEARNHYTLARELNPRSAEPLVNLGGMFVQEAESRANEGEAVIGKILDDALDILEEALTIRRSAMAYYLLGTAYYKSTFYEEAESSLKQALEFEPGMPQARLMSANLYMKQQQWANALSHLDAYLTENPKALDRAQIQATRAKVAQQIK
jgi:tetratricopeptide (TPR) repeat protein